MPLNPHDLHRREQTEKRHNISRVCAQHRAEHCVCQVLGRATLLLLLLLLLLLFGGLD